MNSIPESDETTAAKKRLCEVLAASVGEPSPDQTRLTSNAAAVEMFDAIEAFVEAKIADTINALGRSAG